MVGEEQANWELACNSISILKGEISNVIVGQKVVGWVEERNPTIDLFGGGRIEFYSYPMVINFSHMNARSCRKFARGSIRRSSDSS
jgi:hypothetical protein